MSAQVIAVPSHYKYIVTKQQTVTASSVALTQLAGTDVIKGRPDNIFVQALSGNVGKIYLNNGTATVGGAGIELAAGANVNLPSSDPTVWQVIGTLSDKLNIIYQSQPG